MESVMPAKKYIVRLSGEEREQLEALVKKGKAAAHKRLHAQILLTADVGEEGPGWKDEPISQALGVSTRTVERVRERLVEQGLEAALKRAPQQVYKRPYDPTHPLVGMDESSKQLVKEVREPLLSAPSQPARYDTEYERNGVSTLFLFFDPLAGWRHLEITEQCTALDWAHQVQQLLDVHYPKAERITRVMDNLNTHSPASLYKAFTPEEARRLLERLEIHYTPKHGSWLNMAEIEFSILSKQCLDRRIPDQATLKAEVQAWVAKRNACSSTMEWRFTTEDARIKLKRLYPTLEK